MSNERKNGWATVTHKDGSSVTGEIVGWYANQFDINVLNEVLTFLSKDKTITYIDPPMPTLPTKPGSVIEAGDGMRFFLTGTEVFGKDRWTSSRDLDMEPQYTTILLHSDKAVSTYCASHGGFTILVE